MQTEVHDRIDTLAAEWDALAERLRSPPWLRPGWFEVWSAAFGRGRRYVVTARRDGALVGLAPLRRLAGELRSAANWHSPGYGFLAEDVEAAAALAGAVFDARPRAVSVKFVDADALTSAQVARAARAAGYRLLERPMERSPYLDVAGPWSEFEAGVDGKLRRDLRRRERRLEELGEISFDVSDGRERLDALFDEALRVEAAGWKGAQGTAMVSDGRARAFYREVVRWAAGRGILRLAFLRLNGRPLAFDIAFEDLGVHYLVKTGFDPEYSRVAPGKLLRVRMLARAFDLGLARYEFLGDRDSWKAEWADAAHDRVELQAFRPHLLGRAEQALLLHGRPLALRLLGRNR